MIMRQIKAVCDEPGHILLLGFGHCEHGMSLVVAKRLVEALNGAIARCEAGIVERDFDEEEG